MNSPHTHPTAALTIHSNLWLEAGGEVALSRWRVALLEAIDATGSIRGAATQMKVTYTLAWHRVDEMEKALGVAMVDRQRGGEKGGAAQLTAAGRDYMERFNRLAALVDACVRRHYDEIFT